VKCKGTVEVDGKYISCTLTNPHPGRRHKSKEGWEWGSKSDWRRRVRNKKRVRKTPREDVVARASKKMLLAAGRTFWGEDEGAQPHG